MKKVLPDQSARQAVRTYITAVLCGAAVECLLIARLVIVGSGGAGMNGVLGPNGPTSSIGTIGLLLNFPGFFAVAIWPCIGEIPWLRFITFVFIAQATIITPLIWVAILEKASGRPSV